MNHSPLRLGAGLAVSLLGAAFTLAPVASNAADQPSTRGATSAAQADDGPAPLIGASLDDRYIVVFNRDASADQVRSARSAARADGAKVTHT